MRNEEREREKRFYYSIIYFTSFIAAAADFASLYSTPAAASYQFAIPTIFALKNRDRARFCHQQFAHRTFKLILLSTCSPSSLVFHLYCSFFFKLNRFYLSRSLLFSPSLIPSLMLEIYMREFKGIYIFFLKRLASKLYRDTFIIFAF